MNDTLHIAGGRAITEPRQYRACFIIVFVSVLVLECDSNRIVPKKQCR